MKTTIVGVQKINYNKKDGTPVDSVKFYTTRKAPDTVGICAEEIYMTTAQLTNLGVSIPESQYQQALGKTLEVEYNQRGFIVSLLISEPAPATTQAPPQPAK